MDLFTDCNTEKSKRTKASFVLKRTCGNGQIRHCGDLRLNGTGRPIALYCAWKVPKHLLGHERTTTKIIRAFGWVDCARGPNVDQEILPDAHVYIRGREYLLETDKNTMKEHQVRQRWQSYEGNTCDILVVTTSIGRMKRLIAWSDFISDCGYFSTVDEVLKDPWGEIWRDTKGRCHRIA